ncbi:MAG TPA: H(+)-transporting ATPase, partial [Verrucomicrobiae bacterium]|nr:H(+)-transporting ATPase [Verrucomicrobiae bacterium]
MKISKPAQREARQLFRSCRVNGVLEEERVRQAVKLLLEKKPRGYLEILMRLCRLVKLDREQRAVRVESAVPLPPDLQNALAERIRSKYGAALE